MSRIGMSTDPSDYISGPVGGEAARTEGGTTRDSGVAVFGANRDGSEVAGQAEQQQTGSGEQQRAADAGTQTADSGTSRKGR